MPSTKRDTHDELDFNEDGHSDDGRDGSKTRRKRYHPSNVPDMFVRNAQYGTVYDCKVGSFESLRLYRVADCTGTITKEGFRVRRDDEPNCDTNFLYYDSPEQYMRHRKVKLDPHRITELHNTVARLYREGKFSKAAYTAWMNERHSVAAH